MTISNNNRIVAAVDVGYGNTKFCMAEVGSSLLRPDHFPSVASLQVGVVNKGDKDWSKSDIFDITVGESSFQVGKTVLETLPFHYDRHKNLTESYPQTDEYHALLKGALRYMGQPVIHTLVSGLPVNYYEDQTKRLISRLMGVHTFPDGFSVMVENVKIFPQPMGGFIHFFQKEQPMAVKGKRSLTIDVGYFTLDWLVCRGLVMAGNRSGSIPGGMSILLEVLRQLISEDREKPLRDITIVDEGLRNHCTAKIGGSEYNFKHLLEKANTKLIELMRSVLSSVGSLDDIDIIIMVGGGAPYFYRAAQTVFDDREIIIPKQSIYSNVSGFWIGGNHFASQNIG
jgi:plasmid segregation protein ParM